MMFCGMGFVDGQALVLCPESMRCWCIGIIEGRALFLCCEVMKIFSIAFIEGQRAIVLCPEGMNSCKVEEE